jgi:hypothetical protein
MKRSPRSQSDEEEQQNSQQSGTMAAPEAASKRDLHEAERQAQEAKEKATEEAEQAKEELLDEIQDLREEVKELQQLASVFDQRQMLLLENAKHRTLGKSFAAEETAWERIDASDTNR